MANQTCASSLKLCALRVGRLDDVGVPDEGAGNLYITDSSILLGFTPNVPDRERLEQLNGCGDQCVLYIGDPKAVETADLTLNLCTLDAELIEMLAGGTVLTEGYDSTGYLAPTDDSVDANGVFVEAWTIAQTGRVRKTKGGSPAFWRFGFPKVRWSVGAVTLENGILTFPLTGVAEPNTGFATGYGPSPWPADFGEAVYGYMLDDEIPTAECGVLELEAA
jgi:hypothetical protein